MGRHLSFFATHLLVANTAFGLLAGLVLWIGADAMRLRTHRSPRYAHPLLLDAALYSLFPALLALSAVFLWATASHDVLNLGATIERISGYSVPTARAEPRQRPWH